MGRRAIPVGLVVAAAAADGAGAHGLAFYALLLAVPAAAVAALETFGACSTARATTCTRCSGRSCSR